MGPPLLAKIPALDQYFQNGMFKIRPNFGFFSAVSQAGDRFYTVQEANTDVALLVCAGMTNCVV